MRFLILALSLVTVASTAHADDRLATYQFGAGWATFGLALPPGGATSGVQVDGFPTQTDVKTTWPDGSIKFAVVTAHIDAPGSYPLVAGPKRSGSLLPVWPQASVAFVIDGHAWVADLPATPPSDVWLNGPLVAETRAVVAPRSGATDHPFLRVIFDVRAYAAGGSRVDVTVENSLNVAEADAVSYDVAVSLDGHTVFARTGVNHGYLARWRKVFASGLEVATVTPDFTPFVRARAVPAYLPTIDAPAASTGGSMFDVLGTGDLHIPMNDHGGRPEIAPYPDWAAQFMVHGRPDLGAYVLAHGDLAGSFGIHIREPDGVRLISIDDHPNFWLDWRAPDGAANGLRGQAVMADNAHQPSLAYVPYLATGDRYYLDEMKFWANFCLLWTFQDSFYNARQGSVGLLAGNEVRGIGWAMRNIGDAANYLPDDDPYRAYFAEKVQNNLNWLEHYAQTFQTPLGTLFTPHRPEDNDYPPFTWIAMWEQEYLAWSVDHLLQQGFSPGATLRDRIAQFQLKLFTSSSDVYPRNYAAPGILAIGTRMIDEAGQIQYTFFPTLQQVFTASYGSPPENPTSFEGYYGVEARLMLLIGARYKWPGAAVSLAYLMDDVGSDGISMVADVNRRSGWAIEADEVSAPPPNSPPALTSPVDQSSAWGTSISLQLIASDADGDRLTYSATNLPAGLTIDGATGLISGTLAKTQATYHVTVSVSDGALAVAGTFTWSVIDRSPTLVNPGDQSSRRFSAISLQLAANDPDDDPLTYLVANLPEGLSLDSATGLISGVLAAKKGTYAVTVSVSDGFLSSSQAFAWTVEPRDHRPHLRNPGHQEGDIGTRASLQLIGDDPDDDVLTYSATGLPPGLTLDSVTGLISGWLPRTAAVYQVTVSTSDGSFSAEQTFTWTVKAPKVKR